MSALLEKILSRDNMFAALDKVKAKELVESTEYLLMK